MAKLCPWVHDVIENLQKPFAFQHGSTFGAPVYYKLCHVVKCDCMPTFSDFVCLFGESFPEGNSAGQT